MNRFLQMLKEERFPLVMSLPKNDPRLAQAAWDNGADVVKIHINVKHHASQTLFLSYEEERDNIQMMLHQARGPMGIVLGADTRLVSGDFEEALSEGFDFISLYGQHAPLKILADRQISKMLAPDYTWKDWEISSLKSVGADILEASVMHPDSYGQPLSARELIHYRHLSQISSLPIVVPTQRAVEPQDVVLLRDNGVKGIMLGSVVTGKEADSIAKTISRFRSAIDAMRVVL